MAACLGSSSSPALALPKVPSDDEVVGNLQWDAGPGGDRAKAKWRYFSNDKQDEVNTAYCNAQKGGRTVYIVRIEHQGNWEYQLDFEEMTQVALHSGFKRRLRWNEEHVPKRQKHAYHHDDDDWYDYDWYDCAGDKCLQWDAGPGEPANPRWRVFVEDKQEEVNEAYRAAQSGGEKVYCLRYDDDWVYHLHFEKMVQVAKHSGFVRRLRWWPVYKARWWPVYKGEGVKPYEWMAME